MLLLSLPNVTTKTAPPPNLDNLLTFIGLPVLIVLLLVLVALVLK